MAYYNRQEEWLDIAENCKTQLITSKRRPLCVVRPVKDSAAFQGWKMERLGASDSILGVLQERRSEFVLDFGEHIVGSLLLVVGFGNLAPDAPLRLRLVFAEVPAEIGEDFEPFQGSLSRAWLQDEIINIDELPCNFAMSRRYAFRYLKIQIIDSSPSFRVKFDDIVCATVSSADLNKVNPGSESLPQGWRDLDRASLRTLANCMQTVFEDGPKRDRRLWVGDLRLQALANYETFMNYKLVKRCLYLFAGLADDDGKVSADLYENPVARRGNCYILDYGALYPVILYDYLIASGDRETAVDLWPVARRQLDFITCFVSNAGLLMCPENVWTFIDWCEPLHRQAASQGVLIYSIRKVIALAREIGEEQSVSTLVDLVGRMQAEARKSFWDHSRRVWISGELGQVSWASWAWMVLSGTCAGDEARQSYHELLLQKDAIKPNGPYLYHHVVEALFSCGLKDEAFGLLKEYWGGMLSNGATTFWEIYNPVDDCLSPYNNHLLNSYCHGWSCTPSYFIRKYLLRKADPC